MTNSTRQPRNRTCTGCGYKGPPADFAGMTKVCHTCNRERVAKSEGRTSSEMDLGDVQALTVNLQEAFESRDGLSSMVKQNLQQAINDANQLVAIQKRRLEVAREMKDSKLINEASKALENAQAQHIQLITRLMEKLQAMEELRAKDEKAKPVTFYMNELPPEPKILPTREVPEDMRRGG